MRFTSSMRKLRKLWNWKPVEFLLILPSERETFSVKEESDKILSISVDRFDKNWDRGWIFYMDRLKWETCAKPFAFYSILKNHQLKEKHWNLRNATWFKLWLLQVQQIFPGSEGFVVPFNDRPTKVHISMRHLREVLQMQTAHPPSHLLAQQSAVWSLQEGNSSAATQLPHEGNAFRTMASTANSAMENSNQNITWSGT